LFLGTGFSLVCVYGKGGGRERERDKKKRFLLVFNVFCFQLVTLNAPAQCVCLGTFVQYLPNLQNVMTNVLANASSASIQKMLGESFKSVKSQPKTKKVFFWQMRVLGKIGEIW
jgi:hypothetical protein